VATSDAQSLPAPAPRESAAGRPRLRRRNVSLLWRVFLANVVVCVIAVAVLAWAPVTVHRVATPRELVILTVGLVVMLVVDLLLLRRVFGPLRRLATLMGAVDPVEPGRRADISSSGGREVVALAEALNAMLDRLEDERRDSARRALIAQESERARVARELHDEVGQTLTAVALRAERAAADPAEQERALAEIAETVLRSLDDVHRIGRELRPEALDDLGLVNALIALCSHVGRQGGLEVERELDGQLPPLTPEIELVIYRVAQEALTNTLRHSGAHKATLALRRAGNQVVLTVTDDGRGLPERREERGLQGMRERAMLVDARLELSSQAGRGTTIRLGVPVEADER
jgi:two-component system, NarL family, sensor histidine kinase UhpB